MFDRTGIPSVLYLHGFLGMSGWPFACPARHMMYTRVRNKALNRLERAAQEHQKRSEGDAEASEGSVTWQSLRVYLDFRFPN